VAAPSKSPSLTCPPLIGVFLILFASYAFFWQSRDWNSASRLMLTYALVDRGTIALNGLENQTRDIARFEGRYYTDKLPGFSLLAVPIYGVAKAVFRLPDHPLQGPAKTHWPADYLITLGTSGLLTACSGVILAWLASRFGCGPRASALVGLAYGLATPAYVYATLSYGHQVTSFLLLSSFVLLWNGSGRYPLWRAGFVGFLTAGAVVVELPVAPVATILGIYLVSLVASGRWPKPALAAFAIGAVGPTLVLLGYNQLAFGSPWDMGYFHEVSPDFAKVHSKQNPLGLSRPAWEHALPLLWGRYRGLLFYAPILMLALPGWCVLVARRFWGVASVSASVCVAVFLVNLSYAEWTGGWCTGPRLLVPLLPFAMVAVAALLAVGGRVISVPAIGLTVAGWLILTLFLGVGGRLPQDIADPLPQVVWPFWRGDPIPPPWPGGRFAKNLVALAFPRAIANFPDAWQWVQFLPLIVTQLGASAGLIWWAGKRSHTVSTPPT
jgi:hypothetical protein